MTISNSNLKTIAIKPQAKLTKVEAAFVKVLKAFYKEELETSAETTLTKATPEQLLTTLEYCMVYVQGNNIGSDKLAEINKVALVYTALKTQINKIAADEDVKPAVIVERYVTDGYEETPAKTKKTKRTAGKAGKAKATKKNIDENGFPILADGKTADGLKFTARPDLAKKALDNATSCDYILELIKAGSAKSKLRILNTRTMVTSVSMEDKPDKLSFHNDGNQIKIFIPQIARFCEYRVGNKVDQKATDALVGIETFKQLRAWRKKWDTKKGGKLVNVSYETPITIPADAEEVYFGVRVIDEETGRKYDTNLKWMFSKRYMIVELTK